MKLPGWGNGNSFGSNNTGYCWVGIATSDSQVFDKNLLTAKFRASGFTDSEGYAFSYVHCVKAGVLDIGDLNQTLRSRI